MLVNHQFDNGLLSALKDPEESFQGAMLWVPSSTWSNYVISHRIG